MKVPSRGAVDSAVVVSLPAWPADFSALESLNQVPRDADVVVVLPEYPPSRAAVEGWNYLSARLRIER